jgi:hypothetical protein
MGYSGVTYPEQTSDYTVVSIVAGALICIGLGVGIYFGVTNKEAYKVIHTSWTASSYLRQRTLVHSSDWCPPDHDAFNVQKSRKFKNMKDCFCSTDDDGVRHCSKCPNYDDWCEYDWYDWPVIKTLSNSGEADKTPTWPIMKPIENQRVDTGIVFEAVFENEDRAKIEYRAQSLEELRQYNVGAWWNVNRAFGVGFKPLNVLNGETE